MNKDKLDFYKKRLIEEARSVKESIGSMNNMEEYGAMDVYYSEISGYDNHPADIGTELFMMEQDNGFKNKLKDILYEIDISLEDIKDGNYGVCRTCEKTIDYERLNLIPYLKDCIECSKEISRPIDTRQFVAIEDDDGRSFNDTKKDTVGFDREDTYQRVASFNMVPGDPSFSTGDNMDIMDEQQGDGVEDVENISQEYYDETLK